MTRRLPGWVLGLGIGLAIVVVVGVALALRGGPSAAPEKLAVGDCFDVPGAADRIGDLRRRACSEPHRGETFHAFEASGAGASSYPSDADWESIVYPVCDPVFETYTGTPIGERLDIDYRYLVPTADRWSEGDRRVTCFITSPDGTPLTKSFRAPGP